MKLFWPFLKTHDIAVGLKVASVRSSISISMGYFKSKNKDGHEHLLKLRCKRSLSARMEALNKSMNDTMRDQSPSDKEATRSVLYKTSLWISLNSHILGQLL